MSQFPLCEAAKLTIHTGGDFVPAFEVEAYLRTLAPTNYAEGAENTGGCGSAEYDRKNKEWRAMFEPEDKSDNKTKENPMRDQEDAGGLVFRAEAFWPDRHPGLSKEAAEIANRIFRDWLSRQPVVAGFKDSEGWQMGQSPDDGLDTHRARLVCVEKLESDSADAIVAELAELDDYTDVQYLQERARALRAKGGG